MELKLTRYERTENSTIGKLFIDQEYDCFTLEDKDRGLIQSMPLDVIKEKKVLGKTAIPAGKYEVVINFSNRFQKMMPLLLNVPGYEGVRIHPGNKAEDTEGCILVGATTSKDFVGNSRLTYDVLFTKMKEAAKEEKIFILIE